MFYRIDVETNKAVEEFSTEPNFSSTLMATIVESTISPGEYDIWNGVEFVQEFTDEEILNENKTKKYIEIYEYADNLIMEQETTFFTKGKGKGRDKDRLLKQQNKRNSKLIKGTPLSTPEQEEEDRYNSFLDWSEDVYTEADQAHDFVGTRPKVEQVQNYNVETDPNWPVWTYP